MNAPTVHLSVSLVYMEDIARGYEVYSGEVPA